MNRQDIIELVILNSFVIFGIFTFVLFFIEKNITLTIGCLSVSIAFLSVYLAFLSEKRMKVLTKAAYNSNFSELNNQRLALRKKLINYDNLVNSNAPVPVLQNVGQDYLVTHSFSIWICLTYLKNAINFHEYLENEDKEQLIHEIDCLLIDLGDGKFTFNITISNNYQEQIQSMVDLISEIDIFFRNESRVQRILVNLLFLKDEGPITVQDF